MGDVDYDDLRESYHYRHIEFQYGTACDNQLDGGWIWVTVPVALHIW